MAESNGAKLVVTADDALASDGTITGTIEVEVPSGTTATLTVSGDSIITSSQTWSTTGQLTYNGSSGALFTVDVDNGTWTYTRPTDEVGLASVYDFVFILKVSNGTTLQEELSEETQANVTVNTFIADACDDIDQTVTGTVEVDMVRTSGVTVAAHVTVDRVQMQGTAYTVREDNMLWQYTDGSSFLLNLSSKTFRYTRPSSAVGDRKSNSYSFNLVFTEGNATFQGYATVTTTIGNAPTITGFTLATVEDSQSTITGALGVANIGDGTIKIDLVTNNNTYQGQSLTYTSSDVLTFTYSNGATLAYNRSDNSLTFKRPTADADGTTVNSYAFTVTATNKYGEDKETLTVRTVVPSATISSFTASTVMADSKTITGSLSYTLPSPAVSPTMEIDVTIDGTTYAGGKQSIGSGNITFSYGNGSSLVVNPTANTFTYTRAEGDISSRSVMSYEFVVVITANGQATRRELTVRSLAGKQVYNYEPAYPVDMSVGSTEKQNTAWLKYIEEAKRIYRLYNDQMNYFEDLIQSAISDMTSQMSAMEDLMSSLESRISSQIKEVMKIVPVGTIWAFNGSLSDIPDGWKLCDGTNGTPNLQGYFLEGTTSSPKVTKDAGLPNITGAFGGNLRPTYTYENEGRTGAFYRISTGPQGHKTSQDGAVWGFDASKSNAIYGKSTTVQPKSYTVYYIIRVS